MIDRRQFVRSGMAAIGLSVVPLRAFAAEEDVQAALNEIFGNRPINEGRVALKLPPIAENGYSVALNVAVDSPMTVEDHVKQIAVFAPRNPLPVLARFHLGPRTGVAEVSTRVRLGGTQSVLAVAEMSDGTLWSGAAETVVTLAACVVL